MSTERIRKFRNYLKKENLDGFIVTRMISIRYLCGFTGTAGVLVITQKDADFLTDSRYYEQARRQLSGARLIEVSGESLTGLKDQKKYRGKNAVFGFEADYITCHDFDRLKGFLPEALFIGTKGAVEGLSVLKDRDELKLIEKAVDITDTAFERILGYLRPGLRENEVAAELEYQMKMLGSEKPGFDTIVASGYRSALPHGLASDKKIERGDFVIFDFGATYKGYVADMTRTVVVGRASSRQKKIYAVVLKAQKAAIDRVKSGIAAREVDTAARNIINRAGYKRYFGHGTGHGIGVYIHSAPSVGPRSDDTLKRGMVITVEPGIYIPKWGGVRIEDDVVVTTRGGRILNSAPKNLLEL